MSASGNLPVVQAPQNFFRVIIPTVPGDPVKTSYLRLGKYVSPEESRKVTGLTTTTSTVADLHEGAEEQAKIKIDTPKTDADKFSATSQNETAYKTTMTPAAASDNNGILIYTDHDLNEKIGGQALQKFGAGHAVEVTTADSAYTVKAGGYTLKTANGVFVTAGTAAAPSNVEITAYGYIKQTAYGPLEEFTYGKTTKKFQGESTEWFFGNKRVLQLAAESSFKLGVVTSCFVGLTFTIKLSAELNLILSASATFQFGPKFVFTMGASVAITLGDKTDMITGLDTKVVVGLSSKTTTMDTKVVASSDTKVVGAGDLKVVDINFGVGNVDGKKYNFDIKDITADVFTSAVALKATQMKAEKNDIAANLNGITFFA